jgi:hypothetical protein
MEETKMKIEIFYTNGKYETKNIEHCTSIQTRRLEIELDNSPEIENWTITTANGWTITK